MQGEFEMSMMGELTFFLGLQIKQMNEGIFINQAKYTKELLKKFGMELMLKNMSIRNETHGTARSTTRASRGIRYRTADLLY